MASTTMTYGKKRSFLGSLGSRRRTKPSADPLPAKAKNPEPRPPLVDAHGNLMPNPLAMHRVRIASVEEIASALLDDSTITRRVEEGVQQSDGNVLESSVSTPPSFENSNPEAVDNTPPRKSQETGKNQSLRSGAPRVQKNSQKSPSKTPSRTYMSQTRSSYSPTPKKAGIACPLVSPVEASLDRSRPVVMRNEGASYPLPHIMMDSVPKVILQGNQNTPAPPRVVDTDEIQEKVYAMLAATDALKPPSTPLKKSSASKMSRVVPSVLAKVSDAWDRLHVKPSDSGSKNKKQAAQEDSDDLAPRMCPNPAARSTSSINTMEIRLNEGHNLNRRKVQQMVGGRVTRKPVADDGKALRNGRSTDDPFAEPISLRSLKTLEDQPSLGSDVKADVTSLLFINPFETEKGFENDLEDRILSASPIGSSTPRIRVFRVETPSLDENANEQHSIQSSRPNLAKVTIKLTEYESLETQTLGEIPDGTGHMSLSRSTDRLTIRAVRDRPKMMTLPEYRGTKKHPSPSKKDLEDLQMALEWYAELRKRCGEDELDELAAQYAPSIPVLSSRDRNQLMKNRLSVQERPVLSTPNTHIDSRSPAKSRTSYPVEDLRNRRQIRIGPAYRPMIPQADETDELQ